jgi:hypothetical protein
MLCHAKCITVLHKLPCLIKRDHYKEEASDLFVPDYEDQMAGGVKDTVEWVETLFRKV